MNKILLAFIALSTLATNLHAEEKLLNIQPNPPDKPLSSLLPYATDQTMSSFTKTVDGVCSMR